MQYLNKPIFNKIPIFTPLLRFFTKSPLMMAWFPVSFLTLLILSLSATSTSSSISLQFPDHNAGYSLSGDAHFTADENSDSIQLTRPKPSSSGIILHTTPLKFSSATSFSSNFTFEIGNRFALVIIPSGFVSKLAKNTSLEQLDENRFVSIDIDAGLCTISSSRVSNVSNVSHGLKNGVKFTSWIDYRAILKRIDVRLTELGHPKPVEPLISYQINLGEMLKGEEVLLGLVSSNEEHKEIASVYSWRSEIKEVPKWMHSMPAIPKEHSTVQGLKNTSKTKGCFDFGFVLAIGCGALAGLIVSYVWSYFVDRRSVQGEGVVSPFGFKYEKIDLLKVNDLETGMK